jgi:ankyrin repeat protein
MMEFSLREGAKIQAHDTNGNTLLHRRARMNIDQVVSPSYPPGFLTRQFMKLRSKPGMARFIPAPKPLWPRTNSVLEFLLEHGANAGATYELGQTALPLAAQRKFDGTNAVIEATKWIQSFAKWAQVNAPNLRNETPLHYAVECRSPATVEALMQAGANANIPNKLGETPLHLATKRKFEGTNALNAAAEWLGCFLSHGAKVNVRNLRGETPLHGALEAGRVATVQALIRAGADATALTLTNESPMQFAITSEHRRELIPMLRAAGASLDTPADLAGNTLPVSSYGTDAIDMLLTAGANTTLTNVVGDAPIHMLSFEDSKFSLGIKPTSNYQTHFGKRLCISSPLLMAPQTLSNC